MGVYVFLSGIRFLFHRQNAPIFTYQNRDPGCSTGLGRVASRVRRVRRYGSAQSTPLPQQSTSTVEHRGRAHTSHGCSHESRHSHAHDRQRLNPHNWYCVLERTLHNRCGGEEQEASGVLKNRKRKQARAENSHRPHHTLSTGAKDWARGSKPTTFSFFVDERYS